MIMVLSLSSLEVLAWRMLSYKLWFKWVHFLKLTGSCNLLAFSNQSLYICFLFLPYFLLTPSLEVAVQLCVGEP